MYEMTVQLEIPLSQEQAAALNGKARAFLRGAGSDGAVQVITAEGVPSALVLIVEPAFCLVQPAVMQTVNWLNDCVVPVRGFSVKPAEGIEVVQLRPAGGGG